MASENTSLPATSAPPVKNWLSVWPDALAFAGGLGMAWWFGWRVRDLVWSLWLSSLVVGYAMIVWTIFRPVLAGERAVPASNAPPLVQAAMGGAWLVGGLLLLAFFSVHFGMFHFVHSVFLNLFFPVFDTPSRGLPTNALYLHVLGAYWPFVLVAAVAEREVFLRPPVQLAGLGLTSGPGEKKPGDAFIAPYKNVVRMHLMIFFFAFASFVRLDNFFVYALVYAVYFFPWRLLRPAATPAGA
jgi:hypothetical protein